MKPINTLLLLLSATLTVFSSCRKSEAPTPDTPAADTGKVYMEFFNVAGSSKLSLNSQWYQNANGDSFKVTKFNYYISNIRLIGAGGTPDYTERESYHLVEQADASSQLFYMNAVPAGNYSGVSFMLGVDSLRNVSGAQSGALDPAMGNFWSWNTGYIMLKFEGNSPKAPTADGRLLLHCGGFSGANSVLRNYNLSFAGNMAVSKSASPHIHLQADVQQLFGAPNTIDFSRTTTIHMPGADARKLADNYSGMFSVTYAGQ